MLVSVLFYRIQKVLQQNLRYLLRTCLYNKPFVNVVFKGNQRVFRFNWLVVVQDLINRYDWDETACNLLTEREWRDNVGQKVGINSKFMGRDDCCWVCWFFDFGSGHGDVEDLSGGISFGWDWVEVVLEFSDVVLFLFLLCFDFFLHPFVLVF